MARFFCLLFLSSVAVSGCVAGRAVGVGDQLEDRSEREAAVEVGDQSESRIDQSIHVLDEWTSRLDAAARFVRELKSWAVWIVIALAVFGGVITYVIPKLLWVVSHKVLKRAFGNGKDGRQEFCDGGTEHK